MPFFHFHGNWFVGDENNINLSNLFQKLFCSPPKVPTSTNVTLRNTIKRSRMFNQLLLTQNVQISIVFLSVKSIIMKIKEWHHVSLTSNISAKIGDVFKTSGPADFKSVPGYENWPRVVGEIDQNKICNSFCQHCISIYQCSETRWNLFW